MSEEVAGTVGNAIVGGLEGALGALNPFKNHHAPHNITSDQMESRRVRRISAPLHSTSFVLPADETQMDHGKVPSVYITHEREDRGGEYVVFPSELRDSNAQAIRTQLVGDTGYGNLPVSLQSSSLRSVTP